MNNAERIIGELDRRLSSKVDLTLYGRAAFSLGFRDAPGGLFESLDIDAVLWDRQAENLVEETNFWEAIEEANTVLAGSGLYVSHLFVEHQVILTPEWRSGRVKIDGPWHHLDLHRLGDEDLFLSKLMRDDPQDRGDALFLARRRGWGSDAIRQIIDRARVPAIEEIREQFRLAAEKLLQLNLEAGD